MRSGPGRPTSVAPELFTADDFPARVRASLAASRRAGVSFEDAWAAAMRATPNRDPDWRPTSKKQGIPGVESPLAFLRRHMQAAYEGTAAARYCAAVDCTELAAAGRRCAFHRRPGRPGSTRLDPVFERLEEALTVTGNDR